MRQTIETAYAKINLSLDVTGRREDGYHLVKMVMQSVDLCDSLTLATQDRNLEQMKISLTSDICSLPPRDKNLVWKAVTLMADEFGLHTDVFVNIRKRLPMEAGLAGGSADAAAMLRAMRDLFVPDLPDTELQRLGVRLGADIPYCIRGGTQLAEGIGEVLTELPDAPSCAVILVKPKEGASTPQIYRGYDALEEVERPDIGRQIRAIQSGDLVTMAGCCCNVLEQVTGRMFPVIGQIEKWMEERGALISRMTGSGPTVFALFEDAEQARLVLERFREESLSENCTSFLSGFVPGSEVRKKDGDYRQK